MSKYLKNKRFRAWSKKIRAFLRSGKLYTRMCILRCNFLIMSLNYHPWNFLFGHVFDEAKINIF